MPAFQLSFLLLSAACAPSGSEVPAQVEDSGQPDVPAFVESQFLGDAGNASYRAGRADWQGVERWRVVASQEVFWQPSINREAVFYQIDELVTARSLSTGGEIWQREMEGLTDWGLGPTAVVGDTVYAASVGQDADGVPAVVLEALSAQTGALEWAFSAESPSRFGYTMLKATETHVVVWTTDQIICLGSGVQGELWRVGGSTLSPLIYGDQVFFLSWEDGASLQAHDLNTGTLRWSVPLDTDLATSDGYSKIPGAANGQVYVIDGTEGLIALDAMSGEMLWSTGPLAYGAFSAGGSDNIVASQDWVAVQDEVAIRVLDAASGALLQRIEPDPEDLYTGPMSGVDGLVFSGMTGFDVNTGEAVLTVEEDNYGFNLPAGEVLITYGWSGDGTVVLSAWE